MPKQAEILKPQSNGVLPHISSPDDFPLPTEPIVVRLTTGRVLEIVIGEIELFYERGEIPDDLTAIAARELIGPDANETPKQAADRVIKRLTLARWLAGEVIRKGGPASALFVNEIWEVWNLSNSPALALANFRRQQAEHVSALAEMHELRTIAEPTPAGDE